MVATQDRLPAEVGPVATTGGEEDTGRISHPAKVFRIGQMEARLLSEAHVLDLDERARERLGEMHRETIRELELLMSPDLNEELVHLNPPLAGGATSGAEVRIAHAQLLGWLEGLFHGMQTTMFEQFLENQKRLEEIRKRGLDAPPSDTQGGPYL